MSSQPDAMTERRKALIARCDEQRDELGAIVNEIENKIALAETVVAAAHGLHRHRALVGAAGAFMILGPVSARSWVRRALWLIPVAIEGYRGIRAHQTTRRHDPSPQTDTAG